MANIVEGEHDWMSRVPGMNPGMGMGMPAPQQPGALQRVMGGLGGLLGGGTSGGLLGDDEKKAAQRQAMMAMAAQLMQAGGSSPTPVTFGQALGGSLQAGMQAHQGAEQQALQAMLLKSKLQQKEKPKRYVVNGALVDENGKPVYTAPEKAADPTDAEEYYAGIERLRAQGATDSDPRMQALKRQIDMLGTRSPGVSVNVGDKLPTPPQGFAYLPDSSSPWGYKLGRIPGAPDNRTEGERKAAVFADRMEQLGGDVLNQPPGIMAQKAFDISQDGGFTGAAANKTLSQRDQKHFNAARGWLAGILRNDTGATITPQEFNQYYPTYFPVPGDGPEVIEQKRHLRLKTQQGVRANSGVYTGGGSPAAPPQQEQGNIINWSDL